MASSDRAGEAYRFDGLRALYVNCTLKRSPEVSNTEGLLERSRALVEERGVTTEVVRAVDHDIAAGVFPACASTAGRATSGPCCTSG
ncbi:hypothetical protein SVIO_065270 [Streptomyces violaceusniger]|uniref:Flavodoxin-like domain-containing protein n=1 Tax=Streptomyces violaceusniger TaxID=68280 RepID=A0A4D4L668_STRVO|nr:hypothetical protein SVIO_065270 [Streptomyces violaceusniger]